MGLNPMTGVLIREGNLDPEAHRGKKAMWRQRQRLESCGKSPGTPWIASEYQKLERGKERSSPRAFRERGPATGLIVNF